MCLEVDRANANTVMLQVVRKIHCRKWVNTNNEIFWEFTVDADV